MNSLKFSHHYEKLKKINTSRPVKLLQVFFGQSDSLSSSFLDYDTVYFDEGMKLSFPIKKGSVLVLLFQDREGNLFTTVRPFNFEKEVYYNSQIGEDFLIEFVLESRNHVKR